MKVNRERKTITKAATSFDVPYQTLGDIKKMVSELIKSYGKDATVDWHQYPYEDGKYLYVFEQVLETDKEMADRIAREEKWAATADERDKAEFERLKKKFK